MRITMPVSRWTIISRGLSNHCPNCGKATLFSPAAHFTINPRCAECGLKFDRGDGFFLGPFVINYTVIVVTFIIPVILLSVFGFIRTSVALGLAAFGATGLPILLYRRSWSWWLMAYFFFLPQKLPQNRNESHEDEEE